MKIRTELILNTEEVNAESDANIVFQKDSLRYAIALIRNDKKSKSRRACACACVRACVCLCWL